MSYLYRIMFCELLPLRPTKRRQDTQCDASGALGMTGRCPFAECSRIRFLSFMHVKTFLCERLPEEDRNAARLSQSVQDRFQVSSYTLPKIANPQAQDLY
jgi:hypothetical protein